MTSEEARLEIIEKLNRAYLKNKNDKMWWTIIKYHNGDTKAILADSENDAQITGRKAISNNRNILSFYVEFREC